jgi:hypothetical protein
MEILRDSIWQFIGVIFAILIPLLFYLLDKKRKEISYEILSNIPLLSVQKDIIDKLQVFYYNKPVDSVRVLNIKICNTGNVAIKSEDFDQSNPIELDFGQKSRLLDVEVLGTSPQNLRSRIKLSVDQRSIKLEPLLLNAKDYLKLKILISESSGFFKVYGRIIDVKDIKDVRLRDMNFSKAFDIIMPFYCLIALPIYIVYEINIDRDIASLKSMCWSLLILYILFSCVAFLARSNRKNTK